MRVHANQINPNAQLDAMYAAQKAAAQREAARTRKKLMDSASEMAGEAEGDACVVRLGEGDGFEGRKRQDQPKPSARNKRDADTEDAEGSISDWA
jgi:hypothetical protein